MKKFILLILSVINAMVSAIYVSMSPLDMVPSHYNLMGEADAYSSKWFAMLMPCIIIVLSVIYLVRCIYAEKVKLDSFDEKNEFKVVTGIFILLLVIFWYLILVCISGKINISDSLVSVFNIALGGFVIYLSNMFGKLKQNRLFGIRLSTTLNSKYVWKKTHRLGGYMGVISGLLMVVLGVISIFISNLSSTLSIISLTVFIVLDVVIPTIYSYVIAHKEKNS